MSNDLISRSELLNRLRGNVFVEVTPELEKEIQEFPTAYDVDKVAEQVEHSSWRQKVMSRFMRRM